MRASKWVCAGALALTLSSSALAQNFQSSLTGVKPSEVTFKKIDVANVANGVPALPSSMESRFSFTGIFRKITNFGSTTRGSSNIPQQQYPNIIEPRRPISSQVR